MGASLGRARPQGARQKFVDTEDLDKYDLKTLVQFILLGGRRCIHAPRTIELNDQLPRVTEH